ncbi:GNAT family N-acetyltransferase [Kitasatospora sp. NPDC096147]|uniref:GNAT family N-acetyltransferase n=1 Tax=Kitasatospora sp. NPDC096147 TaxID=3364093 RepID=UPI003828AE46
MTDFTIETARLRLRPFTTAQARLVADGTERSAEWSPGYPREDDRDVARMVLGLPAGDPLYAPLQMVLLSTGQVIGGLGLFGPPDGETGTVAFGYGVAPEAEGQGYTTEAVRALLDRAFAEEGVRRAVADTTHDNTGSQRVLEKSGLHRTGSDGTLHYYAIEG